MNEDLKIIRNSKALSITLPLNDSTIRRANAMIIEQGLTKISIDRKPSSAPACSLKFLNDFTEAKRITSLKVYSGFYDFDSLYRFENVEILDCFIDNGETLDLSRFKKLKVLTTTKLEPFTNLDNTNIEELKVWGELGSKLVNVKPDPKKLSQLRQLRCLRVLYHVKDFSFEDLSGLDNLERVIISQCNIRNFNGIEKFPQVKAITAWYCYSLNDISAIKKLPNLLRLDFGPCPKIKNLDILREIPTLRVLSLHSFKEVDTDVIKSIKELRFLFLEYCNPIPSIKFIDDLKKMLGLLIIGTKIVDGDITPALKLKNVGITPMRHYNLDVDDPNLFPPHEQKYSYGYWSKLENILNS